MNLALNLLALAGIAAAAWHLVRAAFRFLRHGATSLWTDEMARTHARRGDVTALEEAERERQLAARSKNRAGLLALAWLAVLIAPALTAWARPVYAAYTVLWLLPSRGRRDATRVGGERRGGRE